MVTMNEILRTLLSYQLKKSNTSRSGKYVSINLETMVLSEDVRNKIYMDPIPVGAVVWKRPDGEAQIFSEKLEGPYTVVSCDSNHAYPFISSVFTA